MYFDHEKRVNQLRQGGTKLFIVYDICDFHVPVLGYPHLNQFSFIGLQFLNQTFLFLGILLLADHRHGRSLGNRVVAAGAAGGSWALTVTVE